MANLILTKGDKGPAVRTLQRALNNRGVQRGLGRLTVDGELGPATWAYWERAYVALGGRPQSFSGGRTRALSRYRIVRFPGLRTPQELVRAAAWKKEQKAASVGPSAALAFYAKYMGKKESPAGSNMGAWGLSDWNRQLAYAGAPWCGVMVGKALQAAGVQGITSRVASVFLILDDALNGRGGFASCVYRRSTSKGSQAAIRPGDAVGLYGESTHVELVKEVVSGGFICVGGNTSAGNGSVSNGGMVAENFRASSAIVYAARPNY